MRPPTIEAGPIEWITIKEAARIKDVSRNAVREAIAYGRLEGASRYIPGVGPRIVVNKSDIDGWVVDRSRGPRRKAITATEETER